jgi:hypothetical protein
VRIKVVFSILLLSLTLAGAVFAADPPPKKKPTYPAPEQSNTIGSLGKPRDPNAPALPRESAAPQAAPVVPKVEAEPPTPLTSPDRIEVHSEGGQMPGGTIGAAPMAARVPMGPPPTGFLPDHPFVSGIVAGLIGSDLGAKLYGGPMMGDQDGVMVGYAARVGVILLLAWMIFRLIARRASDSGEEMPRAASGGRREPSFNRGADADAGRGRREPKFDRNSR